MPEPVLEPGSEAEKRLLQGLEAGAPIRLACAYAGVHRDTYYAQRERDPEFAERADRARAAAAIRNLALIQQAAPQDWRAAERALILSFPEHFGKQRLELSGPDGEPVTTKTTLEIDPEHVAAALRALVDSSRGEAAADSGQPLHPAEPDA